MTTGADDPHDPHAHGSLGEEAAKLAEAVQDWLAARSGQHAGDVWAAATSPSQDGAECHICPVCTALRVLRGSRPEAFEHLADAASSFAAAFREMVGDAPARHSRPRGDGGVEHIDLGT